MNKWSVICLVLLVSAAYSQADEAPQINSQEAQYASMRRTACLVLSRYHSNTQKDVVQQVIQGLEPAMQQAYINKIYSSAVQTCEPLINQSQVQQLFVQNPQFDPTHLFHLFETVDYSALAEGLDQPLSSNQQNIVKFMKQFDQQMAIRREEKEAEKGGAGQQQKNDLKILGISFRDMSGFSKFVYVGIFVAIIGAFLVYGFGKLDHKKEKASNKRRKSPKKE